MVMENNYLIRKIHMIIITISSEYHLQLAVVRVYIPAFNVFLSIIVLCAGWPNGLRSCIRR